MIQKIIEYLKLWSWIPTEKTRMVTILQLPFQGRLARVQERQRLYFGRWGRFKWRTESRFVLLGEEVH